MLIWFHNMRGLEKFLLGVFLPVGVLLLFTTISGLFSGSTHNLNFDAASAAACSEVGKTVNRTCTTTCNGKEVSGTEVFECQSNLQEYSDGRCYASECTNTSGAKPTTTTVAPVAQSTTGNRVSQSCGSIPVVSGILQIVGVEKEKCVTKERAKWSEEGIFEGIGDAAFGDNDAILSNASYRGPDGRIDFSKVDPNQIDTGIMGMLGRYTTQMIDSPPDIHTGSYFADLAPFRTANAAGIDQIAPAPIKAFWSAMRNVSYALFVLILVAIGFMIMFRSKLDPRTTVTLTAALPNLVISLVLITFSLALAGLIIDLGAILIELVKNILSSQALIADGSKYVSTRPLDVFSTFVVRIYDTPFGTNLDNAFLVGGLAKALFTVVIATVALYIAFNIFFTLLFKWAAIMIKVIFAPLFFLWGALPGQGDTTTKWFKGFLADVLTFPAVLLILNIANQIISAGATPGIPFPPALGGTGEAGSGNYLPLVGLGVLLLATKVPAMLEDALDVKASGHVAKAGTDIQKAASKAPLLGRFFGS